MAVTVEVLMSWLETLDPNTDVHIDGSKLNNKGENYQASIEVGSERND